MKAIKLFIGMLLCLIINQRLAAQKVLTPELMVSRLKIGDQVPDFTFNLMNTSRTTGKLSDYKGKLVILDYWFVGCTSCIAAMPHMQQLQDEFKDKIQIFLINGNQHDSREAITKTLTDIKKNRGVDIKLPVIPFNEAIRKYFPHSGEPHEVVISPEGKVLAITFAEEITKEKLQAAIEGKNVSFLLKDDYLNKNLSVVAQSNSGSNEGIYVNSSLLGYSQVGGGIKKNDKGEVIGQSIPDQLPMMLYRRAYPQVFNGFPLEIYKTDNPVFAKSFTYDILFASGLYSDEKMKKSLQQDLDKVFNFSLERKKQSVPCLIIRTNKNIKNTYTNHQQWEDNMGSVNAAIKGGVAIYAHKQSISSVMLLVINTRQPFKLAKVIDESGETHEIDIDFPANFNFDNKEKVLAFLHDKGIDLTVEDRELDCVIVSDKNPGDPTIIASK